MPAKIIDEYTDREDLSYWQKYRLRNPDKYKKSMNYRKVWIKNNNEKVKKYKRNWEEKSKSTDSYKLKNREKNLRLKYGLTLQQYEDLLIQQNNSCAVCKRHENEFKIKLAVDHDHKTGEIFGLLCSFCNRTIIGRHRNPELYASASEYLKLGTGLFIPKPIKQRKRK